MRSKTSGTVHRLVLTSVGSVVRYQQGWVHGRYVDPRQVVISIGRDGQRVGRDQLGRGSCPQGEYQLVMTCDPKLMTRIVGLGKARNARADRDIHRDETRSRHASDDSSPPLGASRDDARFGSCGIRPRHPQWRDSRLCDERRQAPVERSTLLPRHSSLPRLATREASHGKAEKRYSRRQESRRIACKGTDSTRSQQVVCLRVRARRTPHSPRRTRYSTNWSDPPHADPRRQPLIRLVSSSSRPRVRPRPLLRCDVRTISHDPWTVAANSGRDDAQGLGVAVDS